ncbi:MAG: DNA-binding protein [Lachnospiraceae bacterium]|nr:DNA-binding protein [Lachnospiraceae bacterium]
MERIVEQTLLYDFYGELLTDHQKQIYELYLDDYSLSEIAQEAGISRQGVHDLVKRCNKILEGYEEKLCLVEKFQAAKTKVSEIHKLAGAQADSNETVRRIEELSNEILEDF